jgi:hypothetical protein
VSVVARERPGRDSAITHGVFASDRRDLRLSRREAWLAGETGWSQSRRHLSRCRECSRIGGVLGLSLGDEALRAVDREQAKREEQGDSEHDDHEDLAVLASELESPHFLRSQNWPPVSKRRPLAGALPKHRTVLVRFQV